MKVKNTVSGGGPGYRFQDIPAHNAMALATHSLRILRSDIILCAVIYTLRILPAQGRARRGVLLEGAQITVNAPGSSVSVDKHARKLVLVRPMSCMPGYFEVINTHTVGSLTIPRASIKWL